MNKILFIWLFLIMSFLATGNAQNQDIAQDTLAFRQYLSQGTIADYVQVRNLVRLYQEISLHPVYGGSMSTSGIPFPDSYYKDYVYSTQANWPSKFILDDNWNFVVDQVQYGRMPNRFLRQLSDSIKAYKSKIGDKDIEKQRLVRTLTAFDSVSTHKPIFYADIYGRYKGDVSKYVDQLFKKSILFRKSRLEKFVRYPKAETLQRDMGVQFVIGLALYESWIRDVREGRVTKNEATTDKG